MKTIGKFLALITGGKDKGLISLVKDKTGKISFKRSFPLVLIGYIFTVHVPANGGKLDWYAVIGLAIAGFVYVGPKLFGTKK